MSKNVLVTGGAGYIGSHTCKRLSQKGFTPVVFDNLVTGHRENVKWGPFVEGDIHDKSLVAQTLKDYQPEAVIHFAGYAYVGESVVEPADYYDNNVAGSLSLMQCCVEAKILKFVFSSSCATYGIPHHLPITEMTEQRPINPYGRTKLIIEQMLSDFSAAYGIHFVALRYFNAAGADLQGDLAEQHDPEPHLIPRALLAAAGKLPVLQIFGDDYDTRDGTCIRDYIHVSDLATGHLAALDYLDNCKSNLAVNLGTGRGISIMEIVDAIEKVTGRKVPASLETRRPGDPPILFADTDLASKVLNFKPKFSDLDTIVRTAAPTFGLEIK